MIVTFEMFLVSVTSYNLQVLKYKQFSDNRTKGWMMVDSPLPTILYTILYLFIVWAGPKLMKDRKPFKLTWLLIPYNLAMAVLNAYISVQVIPLA